MNFKSHIMTVILFAFGFHCEFLHAKPEGVKFEHLSIEDGLSNEHVYCVYQDSRGFIWFGTQDGLNRYDGYNFKVYRHDPGNPNSLSDYAINVIVEDPAQPGVLWIGTREGLNRFDWETETFTQYYHDPSRSGSLSNNRVRTIYFSRNSELWIGTDDGLNKFNREGENFRIYLHDTHSLNSLSSEVVGTCIEDGDGNIWIGGKGLDILNPKTGQIVPFHQNPQDPYQLGNDRVRKLYRSHNGDIWIGTYYGIYLLDERAQREKGGSLVHHRYHPKPIKNNEFTYADVIFEDQKGLLWIGFLFGGLVVFDPVAEVFTEYEIANESSSGAGSVAIRSIVEDQSGVLWIGTGGLGVAKYDKARKPFKIYRHDQDNPNSLIGNEITAVYEDHNSNWWIGTSVGLSRFDPSSGETRNFRHDQRDPGSLSFDHIQAIFEDRRGDLWIGTWGGGLNKLNRETWKFMHYKNQQSDLTSLSNNFIHAIYEDRNGNLWIGTGAGGLDKYDRDANLFVHYPGDPDRSDWLKSNEINSIYEDHKGMLWLGTTLWGLAGFDPRQEKFFTFMHLLNNPQSLSSNRVISIFEDQSFTLWVGTFGGGLNRFDRNKNTFTFFTEKDGLSGNTIQGILEEDGSLWVSTTKGLTRFDPEKKAFRNFFTSDGLPSNQFTTAAFHCEDGAMLFGSISGLIHFFPDSIKANPFIPPMVLTDLKIFNKSVPLITSENRSREIPALETSITETKSIQLSHNLNVFTFEFAALHFADPFKNQYAYQLKGFDREWIYSGNQRFATYTNLDPGDYIFRVKGSNNDGVWNEEGTSLKITILPPWWKTRVAYALYMLIILVLFLVIRRIEMNRLKMRNQLRMRDFETKKLQEVDQLKSRFFANISHEFRTPLTLILGPLEDMLEKVKGPTVKTNLRLMQRNVHRLQQLINQLLDLSRLESGRMDLKVSHGDFIVFLRGVVMSFASLAEQRRISLHINCEEIDEEQVNRELYFDRDKIEKIFTNLLSNAFKFTTPGGKVEVEVSNPSVVPLMHNGEMKRGSVENIQIIVSDTGRGIPPNHLPYIFDRFYQVDGASRETSDSTRQYEGTGIGLALVKELVETHYGSITVSSELGKGTEFKIQLPLGKAHFRQEEIMDLAESPLEIASITPGSSGFLEDPPEGLPQVKSIKAAEKPLVLVVEDHVDVRRYIRDHLTESYSLIEAGDGEAGWLLAVEHVPDLVISDVMMPRLDGFQLCERLKTDQKTSHIPVILLTARAGEENMLAGLETGADEYLVKPFNPRELLARIKNIIKQRRKLRDRFLKEGLLVPQDLPVTSVEQTFLKRLREVLEQHLTEENFGIDTLCRDLAMSPRNLQRKILALTNGSPTELIRSARLERAKYLLEQRSGTVSEIAYQVGFNNLSYFSRCFRTRFGVLPSEIAKK